MIVLLLFFLLCSVPAAAQPATAQADLTARSRAGAQAMKEGRFEEAAAIYRDLLKALPDEPGLLMNLGMALAMSGREADAVPVLERAAASKPDLLPAHLFLGSSYLALGEPEKAIAPLRRVVAAQPREVEHRRMLAQAYAGSGKHVDAVGELGRVTELAPKLPGGWFALGHGYNALAQDALSTFGDGEEQAPWRQLLVADALLADGRLTDAYALFRESLAALPSMVSIHDSIARIYEASGHPDWAAVERSRGRLPPAACAKRRALCEFRAGRYRAALSAALAAGDPESRYWRVRAATELARAAFRSLDVLPDSRERREMRAAVARAERRYIDAIEELEAALTFAPGDPALVHELGTAYHAAREYERAAATLAPLVAQAQEPPGDPRLLTVYGDSLLQAQRAAEALPVLQRAVDLAPGDATARLALGRAFLQQGRHSEGIALIEPHLAGDRDGSLHVQLARAYRELGQEERATALLKQSEEIRRAAQERDAAAAARTITPPK